MKTYLVVGKPFGRAFMACGKLARLLGAHQVGDASVLLGLPRDEVCKTCRNAASDSLKATS